MALTIECIHVNVPSTQPNAKHKSGVELEGLACVIRWLRRPRGPKNMLKKTEWKEAN